METSTPYRLRMLRHFATVVVTLTVIMALPLAGQLRESVDFDAIYKIKDEGLQRSQIMDTMIYLTDIHGPRLTGSPNLEAAADYATGAAHRLGPDERSARALGSVWPRLVERAVLRPRRVTAGVSNHWIRQSVDARYERAGNWRSCHGNHQQRGRL